MDLLAPSPQAWVQTAVAQFDCFVLDHASAERKASAMAISLVVQYPDKYELHAPMIRLAREELLHYQQVMRLIRKRGLLWIRDEKDPYVGLLREHLRNESQGRLLDRLLMGGVIEARGAERFGLLADHLDSPDLRAFYRRLALSEANHADLFPKLASVFFDEGAVTARLEFWRQREAEAMLAIPVRPALH